MNWRARKLLLYLLFEEAWHFKLPKGLGEATVNLCVKQGFIQRRKFSRKRYGCCRETYRRGLRITKKGIKALKESLV